MSHEAESYQPRPPEADVPSRGEPGRPRLPGVRTGNPQKQLKLKHQLQLPPQSRRRSPQSQRHLLPLLPSHQRQACPQLPGATHVPLPGGRLVVVVGVPVLLAASALVPSPAPPPPAPHTPRSLVGACLLRRDGLELTAAMAAVPGCPLLGSLLSRQGGLLHAATSCEPHGFQKQDTTRLGPRRQVAA